MYKFPDQLDAPFTHMYMRQPAFWAYMVRVPLPLIWRSMEHAAYTDNKSIVCGAEFFRTLACEPQAYVICHEIGHCMLRHGELHKKWSEEGSVTGKLHNGTVITYPWVNWIMQHSFDFLVNDMLFHAGFTVQQAPKDHLWAPAIYGGWLDRECDIYVRYYAAQKHKEEEKQQAGKPGDGKPQSGEDSQPGDGEPQDGDGDPIDGPVNPNSKPSQANNGKSGSGKPYNDPNPNAKPCCGGSDVLPSDPKDRDPLAEMALQEAMEIFKNQKLIGCDPGDIERLLDRVAPTKVDWQSFIKPRIRAICGNGRRTWDRLDTYGMSCKMIIPARSGRRSGVLCLGMDTSASVQAERPLWFGALREICKRFKPRRLILLEVDMRVARATEITTTQQMSNILAEITAKKRGLAGNGGTDMRSIDRWLLANEVHPELTVILTDGYTPFPRNKGNSKEVVWVITTEIKAPESAGRTVRMDVVHH